MLPDLINHITVSPKRRRAVNAIAATVGSILAAYLVVLGLGVDEKPIGAELSRAFADLSGISKPLIFVPDDYLPLVTSAVSLSLLFLFSYLAALAGYMLQSVGRVVALLQLLILGTLAQAALAETIQFQIRPVTAFLATIFALSCGVALKKIDDRRRLLDNQYYELKLRNKELTESRLALVKQDETERRLLAADLHDQVLNDLKALKQKIDKYAELKARDAASQDKSAASKDRDEASQNKSAASKARDAASQDKSAASKDRDEASQEESDALPAEILKLLNQAMNEIRNVMDSLSPVVLEHFGLGSAVEECLEKGAQRAGFDIEFSQDMSSAELKKISMVEQQLLYRLVQESITNICKHADASTVGASIAREGEDVVIRITDDGKGMDLSRASEASRGLKYMRLRAGLVGGAISWQSPDPKTGKGTAVEIRCPLKSGDNR